jgi:hypothetical protein
MAHSDLRAHLDAVVEVETEQRALGHPWPAKRTERPRSNRKGCLGWPMGRADLAFSTASTARDRGKCALRTICWPGSRPPPDLLTASRAAGAMDGRHGRRRRMLPDATATGGRTRGEIWRRHGSVRNTWLFFFLHERVDGQEVSTI